MPLANAPMHFSAAVPDKGTAALAFHEQVTVGIDQSNIFLSIRAE